MNGGVSDYLISWNIFLSKTLNKVFQTICDFVNKGSKFIGEHFHATSTIASKCAKNKVNTFFRHRMYNETRNIFIFYIFIIAWVMIQVISFMWSFHCMNKTGIIHYRDHVDCCYSLVPCLNYLNGIYWCKTSM